MKKRSTPYPLIGAVVFGVLAIVIFYMYNQQSQADFDAKLQAALAESRNQSDAQMQAYIKQHPEGGSAVPINTNMRPVLYASRDIDGGVLIDPSMFIVKNTPVDLMKEAYTKDDADTVTKSYALRPIHEGDPLTENNVGKQAPRLADRIPIGMKAMSVPIFDNLTDGFLVDGDKVDILYVHGDPKTGAVASDALLQNIPVLFVPGQQTRSDKTESMVPAASPGTPITLCFEVTLQEAQILSVLSSVPGAHYEMVLRSATDNMIVKAKTITAEQIADNAKFAQNRFTQSETEVQAMQAEKAKEDKGKKDETKPTDIQPGL